LKRPFQYLALFLIFGSIIGLVSCSHYSPKPHGYPKINYPDKAYIAFDSLCPYSFEIPVYTEMRKDQDENTENCWYNLYFPGFKGTLHLSYKEFDDVEVLYKLSEDAYKLAMKHAVKAEAIAEIEKTDTSSGNTVMIYELEGKTASPYNFYVTDNKKHFIRGAFYFDEYTDGDSIAPVFDFIKADIEHLIYSTRFR
jgi:gliding motility-associated lipoprotein GldD